MTLDLNDPIALLLAAAEALDRAGLGHAVYGGLALAVYGEARETRDADFAVAGVASADAADALRDAGVEVSISFDEVVFGGNRISRLAVIGGGSLNTVGLVEPRSTRFAEQALGRALEGTLRGATLGVLTPEDFVLFKLLSTRERDLDDVRALRARLDDLDEAYLAREVAALAGEIPDHDIASRAAAAAVPRPGHRRDG